MLQPMRALSDMDVLETWETGIHQHPLERAVTLLSAASPEESPAHLADLPLGHVNARLIRLYSLLFGPELEGTAPCPACGERVAFVADADHLTAAASTAPSAGVEFEDPFGRLSARLPTLNDMAVAARCKETDDARHTLIRCCVHDARRQDSTPIPVEELPAEWLERLAREFNAADPAAEFVFELQCHGCGQRWTAHLEPAEFLWTRLAAHARTLLMDVHALARAYGWSEHAILAMGSARRQAYLELAGAV